MIKEAITLEFAVQGSASEPYQVRFFRGPSHVSFSCTCQAGTSGLHCKHRLSLIVGEDSNLVSNNKADVGQLKTLVKGTDLEVAVKEYLEAETDLDRAKLRLIRAKKHLAKSYN